MASEEDLALGYRVEDQISGFTGIVTDIGYHLTGCTRYGVMPDDKENTAHRGDTEFFYAAQLEILSENTSFADDGEDAITETEFELGEAVEDRVTGFKGIASTITINLYNCPRVAIQPSPSQGRFISTDDVSSDDISREWFDAPRVERVNEGVAEDFEELIEDGTTAETGSIGQDVQRKEDKR